MSGMEVARLRAALSSYWGADVVLLPVATSTQDEARRLARAGAPVGTVVIAEEQTRGRGRLDRRWVSPPGGLYFTILLERSLPPGPLPLLAGVAVTEALRQLGSDRIAAKWPNDVLLDGRKLAGILAQREATALLLGVGVNVRLDPGLLPPEDRGRVASLYEVAPEVTREEVFEAIVERLRHWLDRAAREGFETTLPRWRELSSTLGRRVRVELPHETVEGQAEDVEADGALRIRHGDGTTRRIVAGDVMSRGLRPLRGLRPRRQEPPVGSSS
jgi:BirA family biotin operon repressor/biotin-[acetyl-CoA-carboxylase] ligase